MAEQKKDAYLNVQFAFVRQKRWLLFKSGGVDG
jgi:hypothetical protein